MFGKRFYPNIWQKTLIGVVLGLFMFMIMNLSIMAFNPGIDGKAKLGNEVIGIEKIR